MNWIDIPYTLIPQKNQWSTSTTIEYFKAETNNRICLIKGNTVQIKNNKARILELDENTHNTYISGPTLSSKYGQRMYPNAYNRYPSIYLNDEEYFDYNSNTLHHYLLITPPDPDNVPNTPIKDASFEYGWMY